MAILRRAINAYCKVSQKWPFMRSIKSDDVIANLVAQKGSVLSKRKRILIRIVFVVMSWCNYLLNVFMQMYRFC